MDSGAPEPQGPKGGPRPEMPRERLEGAPRGRSAGGPGPAVFKCMRCGEVQRVPEGVDPEAVCSKCSSDLHTCSNCKNFDTMVRWECRESMNIPARVAPKDVRNHCGLFTPKIIRDLSADKPSGGGGSGPRINSADDARKAFENLFKK
jgi:hypothetical protein